MVGLPLHGIRVADFSVLGTGPVCTEALGFLGAEVVRIEDRGGKRDFWRVRIPQLWGILNMNKLSVTLDLAQPEAVDIAKRLVKISDVVVENFRPGAMEKLGLGYDALREIKPDIKCILNDFRLKNLFHFRKTDGI